MEGGSIRRAATAALALLSSLALLLFAAETSAHFKNQPSRDCGAIRFSERKLAFDIRARAVGCKRARAIVKRYHRDHVIPPWRFLYGERSDGDRGSRRPHSNIGVDDGESRRRVTWARAPVGAT